MWTTVFIVPSAAVLFHTSTPAVCAGLNKHDIEHAEAAGEYYMEVPEEAPYVVAEAPVYVQVVPFVAEDAVSPAAAGERIRGRKSIAFGLLALLSVLAVGAALNKTKGVEKGSKKKQQKDAMDITAPAASAASAALIVSGLIELMSSAVQKATANPRLQALRGVPQLLLAAAVFSVAALMRMGQEDEGPGKATKSPTADGIAQDRIFSGVLAALGLLLAATTFVKGTFVPPAVQVIEQPLPEVLEEAVTEELIDAEEAAAGRETTATSENASMEPEAYGEIEDAATGENKNEASAYPSSAGARVDFASESLSSAANSVAEGVSPLGKKEFQLYMNQLAGLLGSMPLESLSALSESETSGEGDTEEGDVSRSPL